MVPSDTIGNDPARESLCAERARATLPKGRSVPFLLDARYLASARSFHTDVTLIVIDDGMSPQLVECYQREGTGRYEPASFSPEQWYWHLVKPEQFKPGLAAPGGRDLAARPCLASVPDKIGRPGFDHSVYSSVYEASGTEPRSTMSIAGLKTSRYDILVKGTAFYKARGPDLTAVEFTCLLSPMLELKAVQVGK